MRATASQDSATTERSRLNQKIMANVVNMTSHKAHEECSSLPPAPHPCTHVSVCRKLAILCGHKLPLRDLKAQTRQIPWQRVTQAAQARRPGVRWLGALCCSREHKLPACLAVHRSNRWQMTHRVPCAPEQHLARRHQDAPPVHSAVRQRSGSRLPAASWLVGGPPRPSGSSTQAQRTRAALAFLQAASKGAQEHKCT